MDPRTRLTEWRGKLSKVKAAQLLGCKDDMLGKVERGERMPGRRLANQIKAVVGIPTEAWDRLEDDEAEPEQPLAVAAGAE